MRENRVKRLLQTGKPVVGSTISLPEPFCAELMGSIGFDMLVVDLEHTPLTTSELQTVLIALRSSESTVIARAPWNDAVWVKRILDLGPQGIIFPWVSSRGECEQAVAASKYPPEGIRGWGPRRALRLAADVEGYAAHANANVLVLVQIERGEAVERLDEILTTPGLDGIMIGPNDLAASLGHIGEVDHPEVQQAIAHVLDKCKEHGVPFGMFTGTLEITQRWIERGALIAVVGGDAVFLDQGARQAKEGIDGILAGRQ